MHAEKYTGVRSVQVALDILEVVAFSEREVGVTQIAAQLGLAKGATFRHLHTLVSRGYVVQNPTTARYQIGVKLRLLGRLRRQGGNLFTAAEGPMTALRDAIGETVVLSVVEQSGPRVLATTRGNSMVEIGVRAGSILPFGASAQGKVMLAFGPQELRERFEQTANTKSMANIDREVVRARRQGWLDAPGEVVRGINAIAAPIFDISAQCVGAIAIVGLFDLSPRNKNRRLVSALLHAAERISINLGNRNSAIARDRDATSPSRAIHQLRQGRAVS